MRCAGSSRTTERSEPRLLHFQHKPVRCQATAAGTGHSSPSGRDRTIPLFRKPHSTEAFVPIGNWDTITQCCPAGSVQSGLEVKAAHAVCQRGQMATQGNGISGMSWGRGSGLSSELWWEASKASCRHSSLESLKGGYAVSLERWLGCSCLPRRSWSLPTEISGMCPPR